MKGETAKDPIEDVLRPTAKGEDGYETVNEGITTDTTD